MATTDNQTRILKIGVDESIITKSRESVKALATELKGLAGTQKEAKKAGNDLTDEYIDRDAKIKALTKEMRQHQEVLKQAATLAKIDIATNEALKAQLSILTKQYNDMGRAEKKSSEGRELQKKIKGIADELKASEGAIGNFRRQVGDYKNAFKSALEGANVFEGGLSGLFKMILTNPIGLLIGAVALLVKAFMKLEPVANFVEGAMAAVSATIGTLVGSVKTFFDAISSGAGLLDAFGEGFDNLGSRMATSAAIAYGLVQELDALNDAQRQQNVLNAQADADVKKLLLSAKDRTKTEQERLKLLSEAGAVEQKNFEQQLALSQRAEKLAQMEYDDAVRNGKLNDEIEQKLADAQVNRINLEGQTAEVLEKIANRRNALIEDELKIKQKAADEEAKRLEKIADEQTKAAEKEKARVEELKKQFEQAMIDQQKIQDDFAEERALAKLNEFEKEKFLLDRKVDELRMAGVEEIQIEQFIADERGRINREQSMADTKARQKKIDDEAAMAKAQIQLLDLSEQERTALIEAAEQDRLRAKIQALDNELNALTASADMTIVIDKEKNDAILLMKAELTEQLRILGGKIAKDEAKNVEDIKKETEAAISGTIGVASDLIGGMQQAAQNNIKSIEEQAKVAGKTDAEIQKLTLAARKRAKTLAIGAAIIQTFQAAIAAYSSAVAVPVVGVALGPIAAAAALGFGLANVAQIEATPLAKGGIIKAGAGGKFGVFGGKPHSQGGNKFYGEDGSVIETEKDELWAVVNKKSTGMLQSLSALNQAGGGVAFAGGGIVNKMASGGFANNNLTGIFDDLSSPGRMADQLNSMQPVLVIEDFQNVEGRQVRTQQRLSL